MFITRIEIKNFLSYYGQNIFKFDKGPTIIIGQNNTGKSKLFDAFNWVLYDKAFKTREERWDQTKDWGEELINNLAKKECKVGDTIECSVSILFKDEEENEYDLTRECCSKRLDANSLDIPKKNDFSLSVTEAITKNNECYYDKDAEEQLHKLFPENLSKYFLFQGENISQIMSLNNRSAFTNALRDLSKIEIFERAKGYTDKVLKKIKKEFDYKEDKDKALQEKKRNLSAEIQKLKDDLANENESFENTCRERDIAQGVYEQKREELKKFEECSIIIRDIEYLKGQRESKNEIRQSLIENRKKDVFDLWMYAGIEKNLKGFLDYYKKNKVEKRIPEPIRQEFIREMLDEQACKVCGSSAPTGSNEYKKIQSHLNDKALDQEVELINQLSLVADNMLEKVNNIPSEVNDFYNQVDILEKQIKDLLVKKNAKEEELRNVIPSDVSEDELKSKNFALLQKDHDNAKNDLDRLKNKIDKIIGKKDYIQIQLDEKNKKYNDLVVSSSNIVERDRYVYAKKVNDNVSQFHSVFLDKLINDIEKEANTFFHSMTTKNTALAGRVKVDYASREVYPSDEKGNRLLNINQANKVSLQIAFVAAILSVSNKFWNTYFPFVADAPISALGGNNKLTAVETMITIFKQSIIILKDDAVTDDQNSIKNDLVRNMIFNNNDIKHAYELKMEGETLEEQRTKTIELK